MLAAQGACNSQQAINLVSSISSSVADKNLTKNLTNVGLDIGSIQGNNDPIRPGRTRVPTAPFRAI